MFTLSLRCRRADADLMPRFSTLRLMITHAAHAAADAAATLRHFADYHYAIDCFHAFSLFFDADFADATDAPAAAMICQMLILMATMLFAPPPPLRRHAADTR